MFNCEYFVNIIFLSNNENKSITIISNQRQKKKKSPKIFQWHEHKTSFGKHFFKQKNDEKKISK